MQASSKLAAEASIMIRNQEQAYLHQIKAQTQQQTFLHQTEVQRQVVFEWKGRIALQAGHASPVKWCSKEKVLLGKWSAITMLELQHTSLNEKVELLCKLAMRLTDFSPHSNIYLSPFSSSWPCLACQVPNSKDNSEYAVLCSLLQALTRGRGAAEQDFCANILGAKQNVCWVEGGGNA